MPVNENGVDIVVGTPGPEQGILISTISARNEALAAIDTIAGASGVFIQELRPPGSGPFMWWKTDATGLIVDLIIADGT
jgi:hypothetical protein